MLPYNTHNHQRTYSHCLHSAVPDRVSGVRFILSPYKNSLSVEWSRPQSDVPILYYETWFRRHTGSHSWQGPINTTTESMTLRTSLVPSASYGVQVRAVSAIGEGRYSSEETVKCLFLHMPKHTHARTCMHTYIMHTNAQTIFVL